MLHVDCSPSCELIWNMTVAGAYTDEELSDLMTMTKIVINPGARWLTKPKARPAHL